MLALQRSSWPGNIRELRNVVERAMITAAGPRLTVPVPETSSAASGRSIRLIDVERTHIRRVLESTRWRIRGVGGAAEQLGLPTTPETRLACWDSDGRRRLHDSRAADSGIPGFLCDAGVR